MASCLPRALLLQAGKCCASCTSLHPHPSPLLSWHPTPVCLCPSWCIRNLVSKASQLVEGSPTRGQHRQQPDRYCLLFEETHARKITFCWVTASHWVTLGLGVMLLTSLGFLAYCGARPWCLLELDPDPALGMESSILLHHWETEMSLDLVLPEILPHK